MFLEVMTYRFRGHSMGDPERYRKQEEVHKWQENDPIGIYRRFLIEKEIATEEELNEQDDQGFDRRRGRPVCRKQPGTCSRKSFSPISTLASNAKREVTMARITMREAISQALVGGNGTRPESIYHG
jgi:hypothetical protein